MHSQEGSCGGGGSVWLVEADPNTVTLVSVVVATADQDS